MALALTDRQVSAVLAAAGAKDVTIVDPADVRVRFDEWLLSPLAADVGGDADHRRLLAFLGVK